VKIYIGRGGALWSFDVIESGSNRKHVFHLLQCV